MSTPRRRLVRPATVAAPSALQLQHRAVALRSRLARAREGLGRWMSRLKRAFHSMEKLQSRVACLERQINRVEES
jgi:hypothetical protein